MKVYITGHAGYVGQELLKRGFLPLVCNITEWESVERAIQKTKPDLLIHLAGKSDVDFCEDRLNQEEVILSNVRGTNNIFQNLKSLRLPGVFISTDQVWRGGWFEGHHEYSKRTPPVNFYGMSKVSAEAVVSYAGGNIIRTSYLFDKKRLENRIQNMKTGVKEYYPTFITRSFLHLHDFCDLLEIYCQRFYQMPKVLHLSGSTTVSWYHFMKDIEKRYGFKGSVKPRFFSKSGFAPRPYYGGLNTKLSFGLGFPLRNYFDGIDRMRRYES